MKTILAIMLFALLGCKSLEKTASKSGGIVINEDMGKIGFDINNNKKYEVVAFYEKIKRKWVLREVHYDWDEDGIVDDITLGEHYDWRYNKIQ